MNIEIVGLALGIVAAVVGMMTVFWFQLKSLRRRLRSGSLRVHIDAEPLDRLIAQARVEVIVLGINLYGILKYLTPTILERAKAGVVFRVLLLDPSLNISDPLSVSIAEQEGATSANMVFDEIKLSLKYLNNINEMLAYEGLSGNIKVGLIQVVPPMSMVLIDPALESGSIRVELYPYGVHADLRPSFDLTKGKEAHEKMYEAFYEYYQRLWQLSRTMEMHKEREAH